MALEHTKYSNYYMNENELEGDMQQIGKSLECAKCFRIPIEISECDKCGKFCCQPCKEKIKCCGAYVKIKNKQIMQQI